MLPYWFFDILDKIYTVFVWYWSNVLGLIERGWGYIYDTIRSWASWAYERAQSIYYELSSTLSYWVGWLSDWINYVYNWAYGQIQSAFNYVTNAVSAVRSWVETQVNSLIDIAYSLFGQAVALTMSLYNGLSGWANAQLTSLRAWIDAQVDAIFVMIGQTIATLMGLINAVQVLSKNYVDGLIGVWVGAATYWFSNPAAAVWALIEAFVYPWAEWYLATLIWDGVSPYPERPTLWGGSGGPYGPIPPGPGPGSGVLIWPCDVHTVSGYRFGPGHLGVDIGAPQGAAIWSVRDGVVTVAGWSGVGYGYHVRIDHPGGWSSLYGHLLTVLVGSGQAVTQGQTIGLCNSTGNSTGPHLHLEIRLNGTPVDPLTVLS